MTENDSTGVMCSGFPPKFIPLGSVRMRVTRGYGNVYFRSKLVLSVPSYIYSLRFQTERTILPAYIAFIFIRILTGI